jgi:hypothetical protein
MSSELRENSNKILQYYDELKSAETSEEEYGRALFQKKKEDDINRVAFLAMNAELTGLSLEFRNLYGIEPTGIYKERLYRIASFSEDGKPLVDSFGNQVYESYYDAEELVKAANLSSETHFFVDYNANSETSGLHIPFNPPQYRAWSGDKVYKGLSRRFYKTELRMYQLMKQIQTASGSYSWDNITANVFDCNTPAWFYTDTKGNIQYDKTSISVNKDAIEALAPGGGEYPYTVSLSNPRQNYMYTKDLAEGTLLSFKFSNDSKIGLAYVVENSGGKILLDLVSYNGKLTSTPYTQYIIKWSGGKYWWKKWWVRVPILNKNAFTVLVSTTYPKDTAVLLRLLQEYEQNYIINILYYLEKIQEPDEGTIYSLQLLRNVRDAFAVFNASEKTNSDINTIISAIRTRLSDSSLYGSNIDSSPIAIPQRATDINTKMKTTEIFGKVYATINTRINKRTGTLRELIKYAFNTNEAKKIQELRETGMKIFGRNFEVYRLAENGNNSTTITVSLERQTSEEFFATVKWLSEIYVVSNNESLEPVQVRIENMEVVAETIYETDSSEAEGYEKILINKEDTKKLISSGIVVLTVSSIITDKFLTKESARIVKVL